MPRILIQVPTSSVGRWWLSILGFLMALPKMCWVAGVAVAAGLVFAAWLVGGWGGEATIRAVDDVGFPGFALFATACAGVAARSCRGRQRGAWLCLMIGLAGWFVGDVIWAYYELWRGQHSPFP